MPRGRSTRAKQVRAKPKVKNNYDSGLTDSQRKTRLDAFLRDFDLEVESKKKMLEVDLNHMKDNNQKIFHKLRNELSKKQLKMKLADFLEECQAEMEEENGNNSDLKEEEISTQTCSASVSRALSKFRGRRRAIETIPEEAGTMEPPKSTRPARKAKQSTSVSSKPVPRSSLRSRFVTPANQRHASAVGFNTPLITPKFDPRLPMTPAEKRSPKAGETLMSLQGSPVNSRMQSIVVLNDHQMELDDLEIPDEADLENFEGPEQFRKMLTVFCKMLKKDHNNS